MPQPFTGPATTAKIKAAIGIDDTTDDAEFDLIAAAVNAVVRPLPVAQPATRTVTVNTTSGQAGLTAAAGTFLPTDVSAAVTGPTTGTNPIPVGASLSVVPSSTQATLSAPATATGSYDVVLEDGAWLPNVDRGANMLGARLYRRRNTPDGVTALADGGAVYIQRSDPDVAMLLKIGAHTPPAVG